MCATLSAASVQNPQSNWPMHKCRDGSGIVAGCRNGVLVSWLPGEHLTGKPVRLVTVPGVTALACSPISCKGEGCSEVHPAFGIPPLHWGNQSL